MELNITIEVWQREHRFVAKCPELDFASQGETRGKAKWWVKRNISQNPEVHVAMPVPQICSLNLCGLCVFVVNF